MITSESNNGTYDEVDTGKNRQNETKTKEEQMKAEVENILKKLQGHTVPHVNDSELPGAIERAIRMLRISSNTRVDVLIDVIGTNEGQLNVHSAPSDPDDEDTRGGFVRSRED